MQGKSREHCGFCGLTVRATASRPAGDSAKSERVRLGRARCAGALGSNLKEKITRNSWRLREEEVKAQRRHGRHGHEVKAEAAGTKRTVTKSEEEA